MSEKLLFVDTETGGLNPQIHSLLSIGLVIWQEYNVIDSCEIQINDGKLIATNEALGVNKIDIENHKKVSVDSKEAIKKIIDFIQKHFNGELVTVAGHNVNFDINFIKIFFSRNNYEFRNYFSHRVVDTSSILYFLYLSRKIRYKTISSQKAFDLFNIKVEKRHSALGDALATAQLFSILLKLITKKVKFEETGTGQLNLFS